MRLPRTNSTKFSRNPEKKTVIEMKGKIMTVKIETIGLKDTAQTAARKMKEKKSSLIVMDGNDQAVGIVTERDLVTQVCCRDSSSNEYVIQID